MRTENHCIGNTLVTDDLAKNSFGGVKAVFKWAQERMQGEQLEPVNLGPVLMAP